LHINFRLSNQVARAETFGKFMIVVFGFLSLLANWKDGCSKIRNGLKLNGCGGWI